MNWFIETYSEMQQRKAQRSLAELLKEQTQ